MQIESNGCYCEKTKTAQTENPLAFQIFKAIMEVEKGGILWLQ
jgi:hypothetical protein